MFKDLAPLIGVIWFSICPVSVAVLVCLSALGSYRKSWSSRACVKILTHQHINMMLVVIIRTAFNLKLLLVFDYNSFTFWTLMMSLMKTWAKSNRCLCLLYTLSTMTGCLALTYSWTFWAPMATPSVSTAMKLMYVFAFIFVTRERISFPFSPRMLMMCTLQPSTFSRDLRERGDGWRCNKTFCMILIWWCSLTKWNMI